MANKALCLFSGRLQEKFATPWLWISNEAKKEHLYAE